MSDYECSKCKVELEPSDAYEYRGAIACADCFSDVIEMRDFKRNEIIEEENKKTSRLKGLDISNSAIGKANRAILSGSIEVCRKESARIKEYEGR